jgi:hypothetical protein
MWAFGRFSLVMGATLALAGASHADTVFTFAPSVITAPDTRAFSNASGPGGSLAVSANPTPLYNFLDTWNFTLAPGADVQAFVGSINFTNAQDVVTSGIENLQLNLLYLDGGGPPTVIAGWQSALAFTGAQQLFSIVAPASFVAGNYALNVRGKLVGPVSAYAGTLQALNPVPLPATAPLFAAGLGLLALRWRRGRR